MTTYVILIIIVIALVYFFVIEPQLGGKKTGKKAGKMNSDLTFLLRNNEKAREVFAHKASVKKASQEVQKIPPVATQERYKQDSQSGLQRLEPSVRVATQKSLSLKQNPEEALLEKTQEVLNQEISDDSCSFPETSYFTEEDRIPTQNVEKIPLVDINTPEMQDSVPTNQEIASPVPRILIKRMLVPTVVEQGQEDQAVTIAIQNLEEYPVYLLYSKLCFYKEDIDLTSEYKIRSKIGNPKILQPKSLEEIRLSVDISLEASLGKVTLSPVVKIGWDENNAQENIPPQEKIYQWRIEPAGRVFQIKTEHNGIETAGHAFSIQLETYLNDNIDPTYHGHHRILFGLLNTNREFYAQIPEYLDLFFDQGKVLTDRLFYLLNTMETYTLAVEETGAGGAKGQLQEIRVLPAELGGFRFDIKSPQKNNAPLEGENTLAALDGYNNVKMDFKEDVVITSSEGKIKGIPGIGNIISGASFNDGIADLTALKVKICISDLGEAGKLIKLNAESQNKTGQSSEISVLSSIPASSSASQAMIRRLWGCKRKKIWIANVDPDLAKELEDNFHRDYEIVIKNVELDRLDILSANPPDVLFLDSGESVHDGARILSEIRKTPHMECLPIFMIGSSQDSESKVSEILRSGCYYLTKPLTFTAIRAMVSEILQNLAVEQGNMPARGARIQGSEGLVYQIVAKIGEGGMGYIYEARSLRDQKKVIVKYLPPRDFKNIKSVMRFVQEGYTVLSFHHENLVAGFDIFLDRNRCFYVMEFIEGKTIEQLLRIEGKIPSDRSIRIILQVARALQCLEEEHNLVHRDIKPANILVTDQGFVKLVDFGIAKLSNHHLTTVGIILGTPYYLSPEQILGKEIGIQSDIYSLGATFYHMVTGTHPFQGSDVYNIIHQRLSRDPRDPRQINPEIHPGVSNLILKMLDRKSSKRHESAKSLVQDIEQLIERMESGTWEEEFIL